MFKEFKEFIMRGNVIDMAVAFVMGAAFKSIVDSIVNDILMPVIGVLTAGVDFSYLKCVLRPAVMQGQEIIQEEVAIKYGSLLQAIINFLIIAGVFFLMIKFSNKLKRKQGTEEKEEEEEAKPAADVVLLTEIRDLLKSNENES